MIIYKLNFQITTHAPAEALFSVNAVKEGKLRERLGIIFGLNSYASSAEEEDEAEHDRRYLRAVEDVLLRLADSKVDGPKITYKGTVASLVSMEVV